MDKSRSRLARFVRMILEGILALLSMGLWVFTAYAIFTILGLLFGSTNYYVLLGNSILKVNPNDLVELFVVIVIISLALLVYFSLTYYFGLRNSKIKKARFHNAYQ